MKSKQIYSSENDMLLVDMLSVQFYLYNNGIFIYTNNYKVTAHNYHRIKDMPIWSFGNTVLNYGYMSLEEYIERFLLSEEQVVATYNSFYDMGNPDKKDNGMYQDDIVSEAIENDLRKINKSVNSSAEFVSIKPDVTKGRIRNHVGLDFELFSQNEKNQREKANKRKVRLGLTLMH